MKTTILNLSKLCFQSFFFKGKHRYRKSAHQHIGTSALLILFILLTGFNSFGQDLFDLSSKLTEMKATGDSSQIKEANHIKSLVTDLYPTIYIGEVISNNGDSAAVRVDVSAASLDKLSFSNSLLGKVELITIRFNSEAELSNTIDLSLLNGYSSLKYIRLLCPFECSPEKLASIVTGDNSGIMKFYSISIPS
jgi:hypothetical protein